MGSNSVDLLAAPAWSATRVDGPVLLVDSDERRRDSLATALRDQLVADVEAVATLPSTERAWCLVTLDTQATTADQTDEVFARFGSQHASGRLIVRVPSCERQDVVRWFGGGAQHVICRDEPHSEQDVVSAARKLLWGGASGAECYLMPGARIWSLTVNHSRGKSEVIELCREVAQELAMGKRKGAALLTVAEELLTNALYNAPVDAAGARRFAHLSRRDDVALAPHETIRVLLATDADRIALSVTDPFGSLLPETVPRYLGKCFQGSESQVDNKQGGAGLGLFFVYQSVSHLAVNIIARRQTEMIGMIDLSATAGEIQRRAHSFGLFVNL